MKPTEEGLKAAHSYGDDIARIFFDGPPRLQTSEKVLADVARRVVASALTSARESQREVDAKIVEAMGHERSC